jgi:pimeloyl-ACP methyl ester carboxylesterase
VRIAYDRVGDGPALVLLHPLGGDRHIWRPVLGRLSDQRTVIALDLPGFGESPPLEREPTPRALAEAVAELLRSIDLERPHVAGNSLGGWIALELGLGGTARSVAAIAPAGLWSGSLTPKRSNAHRLAGLALPIVRPLAASERGRRLLLSGSVAHPERVPPSDAVELVRAYGLAPGFTATNNAMRAGRFHGLEEIACPVTLVWPDRDQRIPVPRHLPDNVRSVMLEDAGHMPMWDQPEELAAILLEASGDDAPARGAAAYAPETSAG